MSKKILVVDDEPMITNTLYTMISLITDHEVIEFNEPEKAVEYLKTETVDLILSDFMMPGLNGLEFLRKAKEINPEIITILLTGYADKENAIKSINEVGLYYYMEKPWENEALLRIVENAIEKHGLVDSLKVKIKELEKANYEINRLYEFLKKDFTQETENISNIIMLMANMIEAKDEYTEGHVRRVGTISRKLAERIGLPKAKVQKIELAGVIHDIGKVGVPENILSKTGPLTEEEFEVMKKHTVMGEMICKPLGSLQECLDAIRHHHEKLDGTGYPDGLKEDEISLDARIVGIADIFDALNTKRPYRDRLPLERTKQIMMGDAEKGKIDKDLVNLLFKMIEDGEADDFLDA